MENRLPCWSPLSAVQGGLPSAEKAAAAVPAVNGQGRKKKKKARAAAQPAAVGAEAHAAPEVGQSGQDSRLHKKAKLSAAAAPGTAPPGAAAAPLKPKMCGVGSRELAAAGKPLQVIPSTTRKNRYMA